MCGSLLHEKLWDVLGFFLNIQEESDTEVLSVVKAKLKAAIPCGLDQVQTLSCDQTKGLLLRGNVIPAWQELWRSG